MTRQHQPRVAVLGAGSWGTALAALACTHNDTLLWARSPATASGINTNHANPGYLPDVALPAHLHATDDFQAAVDHVCAPGTPCGLIILGVPVSGLAQVCSRLSDTLSARSTPPCVVWTCKGFDHQSGLLAHQIVEQAFLQGVRPAGMGVLSGPSFAKEVALGLPVALTIASDAQAVTQQVTGALHGANVRIYASHDIIGVEAGGALKNIMAIACGIADGLDLGTNARAALITRSLAEMQRLGVALGGQPETFMGLTGLGDLVLTATGPLSRNRQAGLAIGRGQNPAHVMNSGITVEGARCARAALQLGHKHKVDLPITQAVCRVLFEGLAPRQAVADLLARQARTEA